MIFFIHILMSNIIPIFTIAIFGFILSKKFSLDINTLSKLNFYILLPSFTFCNLYTTEIPSGITKIILFAIMIVAINAVIGLIVGKFAGFEKGKTSAFQNSLMFYNCGNIGIPLITLVFSSYPFVVDGQTPYLNLALTAQIIILVVQDLLTNTVGFINASSSNADLRASLRKVFGLPAIYAIPLAIILRFIPFDFTTLPLWIALGFVKNAVIGIALLTLGIQLANTKFNFKSKAVYLSVIFRLIGGPILALILVYILGLEGIVAKALLISSAVPTAVNTALIAVECDNCPDFAAQTVMLSTLLSGITLTCVIYFANIIY